MLAGDSRHLRKSRSMRLERDAIQLILTSPPFPLTRSKSYGNKLGDEYKTWLADIGSHLIPLLAPDGSIVIEMGNAWNKGIPTMSILPLESLIHFAISNDLHICEQFVVHNPARLPGPAEWVNKQRVRVTDSISHIWWFSPSMTPKADNRKVLRNYSPAMRKLLDTKRYNSGTRASGHYIGKQSFLSDHGGSIPTNFLHAANTSSTDAYLEDCRRLKIRPHPARMPKPIAEFFVSFLTDPEDIVLDPFAGSNTTGFVSEQLGRRWLSNDVNEVFATSSALRFSRRRFSKRGRRIAQSWK